MCRAAKGIRGYTLSLRELARILDVAQARIEIGLCKRDDYDDVLAEAKVGRKTSKRLARPGARAWLRRRSEPSARRGHRGIPSTILNIGAAPTQKTKPGRSAPGCTYTSGSCRLRRSWRAASVWKASPSGAWISPVTARSFKPSWPTTPGPVSLCDPDIPPPSKPRFGGSFSWPILRVLTHFSVIVGASFGNAATLLC